MSVVIFYSKHDNTDDIAAETQRRFAGGRSRLCGYASSNSRWIFSAIATHG